jgi:glycopeptide antibiotics resistance protein
MQSSDVTGRRLGALVLSYIVMTVLVITLAPFRFEPFPVNGFTLDWGNAFDVVMNVVMFMPIGFVLQLSRPRRGEPPSVGAALAFGFTLSLLAETAQLFEPGRFPTLIDLVTNTAGAGAGAALATRSMVLADARVTVRALAVDLPLMGLTYLMVPLLWLVGLGISGTSRAWIMAPLGAAAGWIVASVFTSFENARPARVLAIAAAALLVALVPAAVRAFAVAGAVGAIGLAAAWARTMAPARITHESLPGRTTRRFEAKTLRVVLPLFALYLAASALTPLSAPSETWSGTMALLPLHESLQNDALFRALEQIAAFTLGGYALAEYQGRSRDRIDTLAGPVLGWACGVSALLQILRGWHPSYGASGLAFAGTVLGAALGAWLYVLQLAHVRALTSRMPDARSPAGLRS